MSYSKRRFALAAASGLLSLSLLVGTATAADNLSPMFERIRTVFDVVEKFHKDGANAERYVTGAIKGGLDALGDPYTNYFTPAEFGGFLNSLNGTFSGIGAYLEQQGSYIVISAPVRKSPAEQAGLQTGDRILEVDGVPTTGFTTEKAISLIRGVAGSSVTLKIERPSENRTFTVTLVRTVINLPEVESEMLDGKVGYIRISTFGDQSAKDFFKAVADLKASGAKGLVLDLRQNPGGYVDAAAEIASGFVPEGWPVVWEVTKTGMASRKSTGKLIGLPAAVLVDRGSASASEILAGAIQDFGVAPLVGEQTFGKGTVQQLLTLSGGAGMKVTVAEYLTPTERHVDHVGLTPDFVVANPQPDPERTQPLAFKRHLGVQAVGVDVLYLQYRLEDLGYRTETDGFFGLLTKNAVDAFRRDHGLEANDVVDQKFIEKLNAAVTETTRRNAGTDLQLKKAQQLVLDKVGQR